MTTDASTRITVREATTDAERAAIFRLRYEIYVEELGIDARGVDHEQRQLVDPRDRTGRLLGAYEGDRLIGTIRLDPASRGGFDQGFHDTYLTASFRRFWEDRWGYVGRLMVAPGSRGGPALQALVMAHYEMALAMGLQLEFLHAAPGLVQLYERLGCRRYAPNFLDPELGYRVPMVLLLGDEARFLQVRSPFAALLAKYPHARLSSEDLEWFQNCFGSMATSEFLLEDDAFWDFLADRLATGGLARSPLLAGLTSQQALDVIEASVVIHFKAGDHVLRAGDAGKEMFLLLSGVVEVRHPVGTLARLDAGQVFGEIGFIANMRRTADVFGVEDGELLILTQQRLRTLMAHQPAVAARVLLNLARMLCERGMWRPAAMQPALDRSRQEV
ncbi:MAG: cyclic nucleotide-binding domain-containing protein [Myxococcales bacterium]|nr:cyclic nucleotide-binding domain-containing protein [Polyangiaceae bacterium]MDW8248452.1 cyclic nucleotide-binding domain-containing protein [Myxococcales bacterium]